MKETLKNVLLGLCLLLSISVLGAPYGVLDGFHDLGNGCIFFHITIYEDNDTSNPADDVRVADGWIGTADCYPSGSQNINGFDDSMLEDYPFSEMNLDEGYDFSTFDYSDIGNAKELETLEDFELSVYPNPTNSIININLDNYQATSGFLYSAEGGIVKSFEIDNSVTTLEVSVEDLPSGTYILVITDNSSVVKNTNVVVID